MDNNAFRTLVNQKVKSTKEIAREAVETEFRQKAQKRGGGGGRRSRGGDYDSDSASDNDNFLTKRRRDDNKRKSDEGKDEPEWKRRRKEKGAVSSTTGYRDRAKERREGKNLDYSDTVATTIHNTNGDEYIDRKRQAELSKFLGGDEEHTHLVKGLDMALAQKVRREEMGRADEERVEEDLDQLLENAYTTRQENLSSTSKKSSIAMMQPKSELGKSVQNYLLQQQERHRHDNPTTTAATINNTKQQSIQINPTKQNSIQRSHYTFSLDSTIQKRGNAWDLPQVQMVGGVSGQHHHQSSFAERKSMTPLDGHLIATIRKKLDGTLNNSGGGGGGGERKVMNDNEVERVVDKHDNEVKQQQQPSSSPDKVDDSNKPSHDENNSNHETLAPPLDNNKKDDSDFDSDDDIFANVGAYVPPTAVATSGDSDTAMPSTAATASTQTNDHDDAAPPPSAATTAKKHSSIFDNLITDQSSNDVNASQKRQPMQLPHTQQPMQHQNIQSVNSQNKNVIDRDVFGCNRKQVEQQHSQPNKRRGPQTAAMEGVSMTNYQGGYGEEMDTDFLNEDEDGYQKLKRRSDDDDDDGGVGEDKTVDAIDDEED